MNYLRWFKNGLKLLIQASPGLGTSAHSGRVGLVPLSNTSLIIFRLLQLLIETLSYFIIGIGALKPLRKMAVVVLLRFLLAERLHHTFLFCIRKHQVHAGGKGCLVLIITHHVESIFHQAPDYVPSLLRLNVAFYPELQLLLQLHGIYPVRKERITMTLVLISPRNFCLPHFMLTLILK